MVLPVLLVAAALAQAHGYLVAVGGECDGPSHACTVGASRVPYGTTWANFVAAEPVRKIALSWRSTCGGVSQQGPWHVQWWDVPRFRDKIVNADGSVDGGVKLVDFGDVGPGVSSTRTFYLGPATDQLTGLVTYVGPNTQCAEFDMKGLSTNDLSLSGRVSGVCTKAGCKAKHPGLPEVTVEVRGTRSASAKTDGQGNYDLLLPRGHYTVQPTSLAAEPRSEHVDLTHDLRGVNFTAAAAGRLILGTAFDFEVTSVIFPPEPRPGSPVRPGLAVLKLVDESSNAIFDAITRGTIFPTAKLEVYKPHTRTVIATYSFTNAKIGSGQISTGDGSTEELTIDAQTESVHR